MQELIITTPEQLKVQLQSVVSQTVKDELQRHFQAAITPEPEIHAQNDLLTRKQAANLLGVSLPTLNEWSKKGLIIGYRIATRVRYKRSDIEKSLLLMHSKKMRGAA
jgi:excisionase family DNA binding protein